MKFILACLLLSSLSSFCQQFEDSVLNARLEQIRELPWYDNSVVIYDNRPIPGGFPPWKADAKYFLYDIVWHDWVYYESQIDHNVGHIPEASSEFWTVTRIGLQRPYLYLRDSSRLTDLYRLLKFDNPYIRVYSFAALLQRGTEDLFHVILDNLSDTTEIFEMTGDAGSGTTPPEMMLRYAHKKLSKKQIRMLKDLIRKKYPHIDPDFDRYDYIK